MIKLNDSQKLFLISWAPVYGFTSLAIYGSIGKYWNRPTANIVGQIGISDGLLMMTLITIGTILLFTLISLYDKEI